MLLKKLRGCKTNFLFFIILLINVGISLLLNLINVDFGDSGFEEHPNYVNFILVIILGPIIETVLFNLLPIKILQYVNFFKKNPLYLILIASVCFSLTHTYSIPYVFMTYLGAITLNTFFIAVQSKKNTKTAFILTAVLHSAYNLIGFFLIEVFDLL
jgi:hypothetical protein